MRKLLLFFVLLAVGATYAEVSKSYFENLPVGPVNGQDGWSASTNVEVTLETAVTSTNSVTVLGWSVFGDKALAFSPGDEASRTITLPSSEQRIGFNFYPTWPDSVADKTVTFSVKDVPLVRLREVCTNGIVVEAYGKRFGRAAEWETLSLAEPIFHRKWQRLEILFDNESLYKIKTPYQDCELAGLNLAEPLTPGETTFKISSAFQNFYIDNLAFSEEDSKRSEVFSSYTAQALGINETYKSATFGAPENGGFEVVLNLTRNNNDALGAISLTSGDRVLVNIPLDGSGVFDANGANRLTNSFASGSVYTFGLLKSGRFVKFGVDGQDYNFTNFWLGETLPSNLALEIVNTSIKTNAFLDFKGIFVQDSLPIVYRSVARLDVLATLYTADGNMAPLENFTNVYYRQVKEFYYRNSNARLLLLMDPIYRPIVPPAETFFRSYENEFGKMEVGGSMWARDLVKSLGIWKQEYDLLMFTQGNPWTHWGGNWGGGSDSYAGDSMGRTMFCQIGCWDSQGTTFVSVHEAMHSVDTMYSYSGCPEYPSSHPDGAYYGWAAGGQDLSWCGSGMRPFERYDNLRTPWRGRYIYRDSDLDGLADDDYFLPGDEVFMNSDPGLTDTDDDGLSDLREYLVGLYFPSDATVKDTDGDGLEDGVDPFPIITYNKNIPRLLKAPKIDGVIDEGEWTLFGYGMRKTYDPEFDALVYAGWTEDAIYFAFDTTKMCGIMIEIDGSAATGPWFGGDYFKFKVLNQYRNRIYGTKQERSSPDSWDLGAVPTGSQVYKTVKPDGGFVVEVKIPCYMPNQTGYSCWKDKTNPPDDILTNRFTCEVGGSLGLCFGFDGIGSSRIASIPGLSLLSAMTGINLIWWKPKFPSPF